MIGSLRSTCLDRLRKQSCSLSCQEAPEVDSDDDMGFRMHLEARISMANGLLSPRKW